MGENLLSFIFRRDGVTRWVCAEEVPKAMVGSKTIPTMNIKVSNRVVAFSRAYFPTVYALLPSFLDVCTIWASGKFFCASLFRMHKKNFFCASLFRKTGRWLSCKALAIGAGGLGFDYRAGQIDTVSPTTRHRCDVSSELCSPGAQPRRWAPQLITRFGVIRRV